ncbi:MAG: SDR family oxidoreductase [Micropruina sp.]
MDLGLASKVFVITAASAGLGRAAADQLLAEGARVVLVARRAEVLAQAVTAYGADRVAVLPADLAAADTPQRAVDLALASFGRLDGALVSVGGPPRGTVLGTADQEWTEAFESVFLPALRSARAVIGGAANPVTLAFVLSTSAKVPLPSMALSNGLRPGLAMLIKQLADEVGPVGTRVVGLLPGTINTERITWLHSQSADPAATRAAAEAGIPLRRLGRPAEFGRVAAFVLSPAASYLTGCLIPVDGGALRAL